MENKTKVFFFQAEDGIRDLTVTGVQTCALPILMYCGSGVIASRLWQAVTPDPQYITASAGARPPSTCVKPARSEERRVGKECRSRWRPNPQKKKYAHNERLAYHQTWSTALVASL